MTPGDKRIMSPDVDIRKLREQIELIKSNEPYAEGVYH